MIIAIVGGPRTGKSTLAEAMALRSGTELVRTDDLIPLGWSAASLAVAEKLLATTGDLIVEGVAVPRSLRRAMKRSDRKPCDRLIVLWTPRPEVGALLPGQRAMAKGVRTTLLAIWPELKRRKVEIVDGAGRPMRKPAVRAAGRTRIRSTVAP